MRRLVLDTSYLVGHFNPDDAHHERALDVQDSFMSGEWEELLLVDSVFAETITVIANRRSYLLAKQVGEALRNAEEISWVSMSDHIDDTWHQYLVQPAEDLSLVDCAMIAVARAFGTKHIASFDRSFDEVPGIVRVPSV